MLKRVFSLFAALLLLCSAVAFAAPEKYRMIEGFEAFDLEVEIPEGALYRQNLKDDDWLSMEIWFEDPSKPLFTIHVAYSDIVGNKFLADFDQEEIDHLLDLVGADFSIPAHEFFITPAGNTILFTHETDPQTGGYATMVTVYKGFVFSLYGRHKDYAPLAEEDIRLMHQIVEGTWIIDAGE
ncbi:MAG: hypothetical protein FWD25_01675 [Clostridia bacterium]|nr:hypothetical protein [Clostridia bacterium]